MKPLQTSRWWGDRINWSIRFLGYQIGRGLVRIHTSHYHRIIYALILTNSASVLLFGLRLVGAENFRYWFMLWNLTLAWIAPLVAWYLVVRLRTTRWKSWQNLGLTILWLGFLPNSFYMVSDLIHVHQSGEVSIIFDAVLFTAFVFNGFIAGFLSTLLIHRQLVTRMSMRRAFSVIVGVFFLCSYAIYLGRVLRWNTWDAVLHPAGLLFDVSDNILHPVSHPQAFVVTFSFTLLITSFYLLVWEIFRTLTPHNSQPGHERSS